VPSNALSPVFSQQSVPDVIELILREHQMQGWKFEFHLQRPYSKREQINQINESDWQFIERLLSEVGIFYSFSLQTDTKTEMIHFGDSQRMIYSCYSIALLV